MSNSIGCGRSARRSRTAIVVLCSMLCLIAAGCAKTRINVIQNDGFMFVSKGELLTVPRDGVYMDIDTFIRVGEAKIIK